MKFHLTENKEKILKPCREGEENKFHTKKQEYKCLQVYEQHTRIWEVEQQFLKTSVRLFSAMFPNQFSDTTSCPTVQISSDTTQTQRRPYI